MVPCPALELAPPINNRFTEKGGRPGILLGLFGGTGLSAGRYFWGRALKHRPFPLTIVQMDTDPVTEDFVHEPILTDITEMLDAVKANPALFGDLVRDIVKNHSDLLNREDVGKGSRSIRLLTQLCFLTHLPEIIGGWRRAILALHKQGDFDFILPIFVSSTGGGAGSAFQILMAQALTDQRFRANVLEGLGDEVLQTPIAFVAEPFGHMLYQRNTQANMVLANAFAFRMESAVLESQNAYKYIFHFGLGNNSGVVLDSAEESAKVMGICLYEFCRNWSLIKSHLVNNIDIMRLLLKYIGDDLPENALPDLTSKPPQLDPGKNGQSHTAHGTNDIHHGNGGAGTSKDSHEPVTDLPKAIADRSKMPPSSNSDQQHDASTKP